MQKNLLSCLISLAALGCGESTAQPALDATTQDAAAQDASRTDAAGDIGVVDASNRDASDAGGTAHIRTLNLASIAALDVRLDDAVLAGSVSFATQSPFRQYAAISAGRRELQINYGNDVTRAQIAVRDDEFYSLIFRGGVTEVGARASSHELLRDDLSSSNRLRVRFVHAALASPNQQEVSFQARYVTSAVSARLPYGRYTGQATPDDVSDDYLTLAPGSSGDRIFVNIDTNLDQNNDFCSQTEVPTNAVLANIYLLSNANVYSVLVQFSAANGASLGSSPDVVHLQQSSCAASGDGGTDAGIVDASTRG